MIAESAQVGKRFGALTAAASGCSTFLAAGYGKAQGVACNNLK